VLPDAARIARFARFHVKHSQSFRSEENQPRTIIPIFLSADVVFTRVDEWDYTGFPLRPSDGPPVRREFVRVSCGLRSYEQL